MNNSHGRFRFRHHRSHMLVRPLAYPRKMLCLPLVESRLPSKAAAAPGGRGPGAGGERSAPGRRQVPSRPYCRYGAAGAELLLPARPVATSWATACSSSHGHHGGPLCGGQLSGERELSVMNNSQGKFLCLQ